MKKVFLALVFLALPGSPQDSPKDSANPPKPATQLASPDPLALERWLVGRLDLYRDHAYLANDVRSEIHRPLSLSHGPWRLLAVV